MSSIDLAFLGTAFGLPGDFLNAVPYGSGHINDTFAASYSQAGCRVRYLHQRINHRVFRQPRQLMENIARVTRHAGEALRLSGVREASRRALTIVPTPAGEPCFEDAEGNFWRTYYFIENAASFDKVENPRQAREAARAFGEFQGLLADLSGERLHETIPNFHHTRSRFNAFAQAHAEDPLGRARAAHEEIQFALQRESMVDALIDLQGRGELPERVTHNDTKLNNVMFDTASGQAICVIDLDTVMPGLALYDFGDMVRTATSPALEDETDLSKVTMQMPMFEALAAGYVEATRSFLTPAEKARLAFSGKLISFEIGLRFLTDFLQGDTYFKTKRPGHNLDRCRTQFKLVESIEAQEDTMRRLVDAL